MAVYAQQFNDFLPAFSNGAGYWMHDEPLEFSQTLLNTPSATATGLDADSIRKWFYCPSNYNSNVDALWNYGPLHGQFYRAQGYSYLNDRHAGGGAGNYPALPVRTAPKLAYHAKMVSTYNASDSELVLDEIMSPDDAGYSSQFSVPPPTNGAPAGTSHLQGAKPAGANVLACDGHAVWRKFPSSGNTPGILPIFNGIGSYSWIINPW
jgi:prepilin-type processing-associated H-X9-DG protein